MKSNEVSVGNYYWAKVSDVLTTVRLDEVRQINPREKRYDVTNMVTGRQTTFRSAAKFRSNAQDPSIITEVQTVKKLSKPVVTQVPDTLPEITKKPSGLSDKLGSKLNQSSEGPPHIIVKARAGCGKTTTMIEALKLIKGIPSELTPSSQQQAIWDSVLESKNAGSIGFISFSRAIAEELKNRVPFGVESMTTHAMGRRSIINAFGQVNYNEYRSSDILQEIVGKDIRDLRRDKPEMVKAVIELVSLCKMNLVDDEDSVAELADHHEIECGNYKREVFSLVPRVLKRGKDISKDNCMEPDDMVWIPVVLNLNVKRYDLLLIDEFQDTNLCQQALAKKAGKRLVAVGDDKQAIFGFAGADAQALKRFEKELGETSRGCLILPLTVTRRCGKAIVKEAQKYVSDFEAHESNSEGKISTAQYKSIDGKPTYRKQVEDGDMVICRCNGPLVSQCFKFLREGRKAQIQGRDVGQGLISTLKKVMKGFGYSEKADEPYPQEMDQLHARLSDWIHEEETKENAKRNPSESRLIGLQDRYDCLVCFTEGMKSVQSVIERIQSIFTDDKNTKGIKLSSGHRSKGLEANRVFILQVKGTSFQVNSAWEAEQEENIRYVMCTRAINELVYVVEE